MSPQHFRYSLASSAKWFVGVSLALAMIRLGLSRGLPAIFLGCALLGFFLVGACLGIPVGLLARGDTGVRPAALAGAAIGSVVGVIWMVARFV
jgi:hypothetical protein